MSREFGVYPATKVSLRPAAFAKSAKNFAKKRQKMPKIALGAHFPRQNVVSEGCNKLFFQKQLLYACNLFVYKGYPPEYFPAEIIGCYVAM